MENDYRRVAAAIAYISDNVHRQPGLDEIAAACGLSVFHFQRLFRRWAGVSPKRFLQYLTVEHAKACLARSQDVLDTSLAVGLSGPGRLHDHFVTLEAVTPGEFRRGGRGLSIRYGRHATPFGDCVLAQTSRGVCGLGFIDDSGDDSGELDRLRRDWPHAVIERDDETTATTAARLFDRQRGDGPLSLLVRGTNFQVQVWRALLRIPQGEVATYGQIAATIGRPSAARATGAAIGANPVGWLIPCHRVIRAGGLSGDYRWGGLRKRAMLGWEAASADAAAGETARAGAGAP